MLELEECRQHLGSDCPLTDPELETLRSSLYSLAEIVMCAAADDPDGKNGGLGSL